MEVIRFIVRVVMALWFVWMAAVLLAPTVIGLAQRDLATGNLGLAVATWAVGLLSLGGGVVLLRRARSSSSA